MRAETSRRIPRSDSKGRFPPSGQCFTVAAPSRQDTTGGDYGDDVSRSRTLIVEDVSPGATLRVISDLGTQFDADRTAIILVSVMKEWEGGS
jgi:hypothetical protein